MRILGTIRQPHRKSVGTDAKGACRSSGQSGTPRRPMDRIAEPGGSAAPAFTAIGRRHRCKGHLNPALLPSVTTASAMRRRAKTEAPMIREIVPNFLKSATKSIIALSRLNKTVAIMTGLVVPTIVGIYCTYYSELAKVNPLLFWGPVIMMIMVGVLWSVYTWDVPLPAEALTSYLVACEERDRLEVGVASLSTLQQLISVWRTMSDQYLEDRIRTKEQMRDAIKTIMELVATQRDALFNMGSNELWNFAVYFYSAPDDILTPVWRDRHPNHPSTDMGRLWKPGIGHIGMAFSRRRTTDYDRREGARSR